MVGVLRGLRVAVVVVGGRVGGLFKVPLVDVRDVDVAGFEVDDVVVVLFVVVVPEAGRLGVAVEVFFTGDADASSLTGSLSFSVGTSFSLRASGLVIGSSLPETTDGCPGVAGAGLSDSTSGVGVMGSSVEAMLDIAGAVSQVAISQQQSQGRDQG